MPRGDGGVIDLRYTPDRAFRLGLAAGGVLALILLALALAPTRRPDAPPTLTADVRLAARQPRRRAVWWSARARHLAIAAYATACPGRGRADQRPGAPGSSRCLPCSAGPRPPRSRPSLA